MQPLRGLAADAAGHAIRAQPRAMKRFVRVDVADAGNRRLVEEDRLQRSPPFAKPAVQLFRNEVRVDRFGTQKRHLLRREQRFFRAQQQPAETPNVPIAQVPAIVQREDGVRVRLQRCIRADKPQLPSHAQVNDQQHVALQLDEDVLSAPSHIADPHAGNRLDELFRLRMPNDAWEPQLAAHDGAAGKVRPQVGDDCFYFW